MHEMPGDRHGTPERDQAGDHHPDAEAGQEDDAEAGGGDQDRGPEVGLLGDQGGRNQHDQPEQYEIPRRRRQGTLAQVPGAHHRHAKFHDFGRLETETAERQPALGALADRAGHGDGEQQDDADQVHGRRQPLQPGRRYLRQQEKGAYREPEALDLIEPLRQILAGRAVEHEQAVGNHDRQRREQGAVEMQAPQDPARRRQRPPRGRGLVFFKEHQRGSSAVASGPVGSCTGASSYLPSR